MHPTLKMPRALIALLAIAALAACSHKTAHTRPAGDPLKNHDPLQIKNAEGKVLATGALSLPGTLPPDGTFAGRWLILHAADNPHFRQLAGGTYAGQIHNGAITIDLTPTMRDNNLLLTGTILGDTFSGDWSHTTITGAEKQGTFTLKLTK